MRRSVHIFLAAGLLGLLCSLAACRKDTLPQPDFPLGEEAVAAALESSGLPGEISESETDSYDEGHTIYVVRSQTEAYSDSVSPEEAPDETAGRVLTASASSAVIDGGRTLYTTFDRIDVSEQFAWEDWKAQLVFAALLFGGFEDEEEVYRAFLDQGVAEGEEGASWQARLPGGYCWARYAPRSTRLTDGETGIQSLRYSGTLFVNIYESEELFQKHLERYYGASDTAE